MENVIAKHNGYTRAQIRAVTQADKAAEIETRQFLDGAVADGRLDGEERKGLELGSEPKPQRYRKTFDDFIRFLCHRLAWPEDAVRKATLERLGNAGLGQLDAELFLNCQDYTQTELAGMYDMPQTTVSSRLRKAHKVLSAMSLSIPTRPPRGKSISVSPDHCVPYQSELHDEEIRAKY